MVNRALRNPAVDSTSAVFSSDGDLRIGGEVLGVGPAAISSALRNRGVWTEISTPHLKSQSIRMLSPEIAVVDATSTQYGSLIVKRTLPVLLILRKNGTDWRVISLRFTPPCAIQGQTNDVAEVL